MLELRPLRRDPRLLVVDLRWARARYVALDAWELSGLGTLPKASPADRLVLWQLMTRTKPSHVVLVRHEGARETVLLRGWRERALRMGLPLGVLDAVDRRALLRAAPSLDQLAAAYPEVRHIDLRPRGLDAEVLRLAAAVLTTRSLPPRRYVPGHALHHRPPVAH